MERGLVILFKDIRSRAAVDSYIGRSFSRIREPRYCSLLVLEFQETYLEVVLADS